MIIDQLTNAGSLPALEATMRFASQRQSLIANNIANFETPNYIPVDVSPSSFQSVLADAIDSRRKANGGMHGGLHLAQTQEIRQDRSGALLLRPRTPVGGVLGHDRNASDLERTMQSLVENAAMFRIAAEFHRSRLGVVKDAIAERAI